jgi:TrmH family RNA methyltransferase
MPRLVTAHSNPLIKSVRALRDKKGRREQGSFLAEGLRVLTDAREQGRLPSILLFTPDAAAHPLAAALIAETEVAGGDAVETTPEILSKTTGKDNAQGVLGVFRTPDPSLGRLDRASAPLWIVAQALRDPGNLGTILRTGDAVGAGGLVLIDDCADPFSVEAVRASMGAVFTQQIAAARWEEFLPWLRAGEGQLVATSLQASEDYQQPRYAKPCFLLVGNEQAGLPAEYADAADLRVRMPMLGRADSLNAAVATAVMAYEVINQWRR